MNDPDGIPAAVWSSLIVRLEYLQNLFFIERLLLRRGHEDTGDLLLTCVDLLSSTLPFWTHLDKFMSVRPNCEWLVRLSNFYIVLVCMDVFHIRIHFLFHLTPCRIKGHGLCCPGRRYSL